MLENITFSYFAEQVVSHPALLIAVLLTLGVILVNGWTDAPNAIATCVSTRCIDVDKAIIMAAACNFLGVLIMSLVNSKVAMTIKNMVNFGGDTDSAMIALCAAMTAIVIWAIGAWAFGIPTSESHALIAGLTGAAIALQGGLDGVNPSEWIKVIYGLVLSTVLGFAVGFVVCKLLAVICYRFDRRKTNAFFLKSTGGRLGGGGIHARSPGRSEVPGSSPAWAVSRKWTEQCRKCNDTNMDDDTLLGCHGTWNINWRKEDHQVCWNGYGKA